MIRYDDTDERRKLEKRIAQVQRDGRCVRRAASVAALCTMLAMAGLAYGAVLDGNFPYNESQFVIRVLSELGLASLICLVAFAGLLTAYRKKLNRLREECRRLITRLVESHLGQPHLAAVRGSPRASDNREVAEGAAEVNGSPGSLDSLRELAAAAEDGIVL